MIETTLYNLIAAKVKEVDDALAAGQDVEPAFRNLAGLFVHDSFDRAININDKPNGIRVGRPFEGGEKSPGISADKIVEANCAIPVLVYVLVDGTQDGGDARAVAFEYADAIANTLVLWLWNGALDAPQLIFADARISFARVNHVYDSNPYAVVSMTLTLSEVAC